MTPTLGGVAIFTGFTLSCLLWSYYPDSPAVMLLPALIIPFVIGLFDDLIQLKPFAKLLSQIITASIIFFLGDLGITSSYGLFDLSGFSTIIGYLITLFVIVVITNSFNLIDGIDGLAGTFSFIATLFYGSWFFFSGNQHYAILCLALAGSILAFLYQNWEPSEIFMGDTGSMVIGTLLAVFTIEFINQNYQLDDQSPMKFSSSIGTAICVLIIPLADTTRVVLIRALNGISPFTADKRHIHHALVRLNFSHRRVVYMLTLIQVIFIGLAIIFKASSQWVVVISSIVIASVLCVVLDRSLLYTLQKRQRSESI